MTTTRTRANVARLCARGLLAALALAAPSCSTVQDSPSPGPVLKRSIPLEAVSGRIDHLAFDPQDNRLFIAALENGSLEVVDLEKGERVKSVTGLKEPQGVVYVPATGQAVVSCGGDGTIRAFDALTLEEKQRVNLGEDADNVRLSADGQTIAVGYGDGALALLDARTLKKSAEVKLSGHPEAFALDAARAFVNVPGGVVGGGGEVAVVDLSSHKVSQTWKPKEAGRNFPMAFDAKNKRLYAGCRRPARLLVIDTDTGNVIASPECVGDADEVFLDPKTGQILVIGGDGFLDVFESKDQHSYAKLASVKTPAGARTGLLIPERRAVYVAVPKRAGQRAEVREYALDN
jgi:Cytochrome D1 heme domain